MKLILLLRVKDGEFYVKEWLSCFEKIVDEIVVVDNGSTDGTFELLLQHPKVVEIVQTEGFDEGRDKNLMYSLARKRNPDWCLWLDIDEIFEEELNRYELDLLMSNKSVNQYWFRRFHFIDKTHFAGSLFWLYFSASHDRVMWRENSNGYFENLKIDSPNVKGILGKSKYLNIRLKHLGYINKQLVDRKANIYREIIPEKENTFKRMYLEGITPIKWIISRASKKLQLFLLMLNILNSIKWLVRGYNKVINIIFRKS